MNAYSTMTKSGNEYTITNAAQSQYHFNADGELDWVKDANGNILTVSAKANNQRIVTDSTGRTYTIIYNGNAEHSRVLSIEDDKADRIVTYEYNGDFQLVSATNVFGGTKYYEYDENGRLCKITNCYDEMTDQIVYNTNGSVNWLTNAAGLKQEYTARQTEAMGNTTKYEYNFPNKLTKAYAPFDGEKYSITENQYDKNGNVIKTIQNVDDNKNSVTQNQYNAMGLLEKVTLSDGTANGENNISKYFYNNAGIQTKMCTGTASENDDTYLTTEYEFDSWMKPK